MPWWFGMKKKEIKKRVISLISTSLFLVGSTYLWANFKTIQTEALGKGGAMDQMYLSIEEVGESVLMEEVYPESDASGMKHDGYTFKICNSKNKKVRYKLSFITDSSNTLDNKYIRYTYNVNGGEYMPVKNLGEDAFVTIDSVSSLDENTYNLKFWIDYDAGNEIMNKSFSARIGVQSI